MPFPVGYRSFHPDAHLNFELNRWSSVFPEEDLRSVAGRIATMADWKAVMLEAAERAAPSLRAAFYYRAAEFFMHPSDPDKARAYDRFVELFDRCAGVPERRRVPYGTSWLPAIVVPAQGREKETVLLHGGFDSFMEEFVEWAACFAAAGYRVVLFEGPGQGAALRRNGLVMGPDWERPVAAVLDHLAVERCTIVGVSLGGCLAPRAAAFEPRIRRVVAFDVLDDFFDCFAARAGDAAGEQLRGLLSARRREVVNELAARMIAASPVTEWAVAHGCWVSGARDPYDFLVWLTAMTTAPVSSRITQDVLLLAGAADHLVPLRQFHRQAQSLPNVRSLTGRVFTAREHAANHCQVGNVGLALEVILGWLDFQRRAESEGLVDRDAGGARER